MRFSELAKPQLPMEMGTPGHCCNLLTGLSSSHACVSETVQGCGGVCASIPVQGSLRLCEIAVLLCSDKVSRAVGSMASFLCSVAYAKPYSTIKV